MHHLSLIFLSSLALAVLGLSARADTRAPDAPLGPNAVVSGGEYTSGGGLSVAMEARQINGRLGLCGVWAQSDAMSIYTRNAGRQVLSKGSVALNGKVVTKNFNFLNRVRAAKNYAGAPAGCVMLEQLWRPQDAIATLEIRIPRQKVHLTANKKKGASPRVWFTRSDNSNPALFKGSLLPSKYTSFGSGNTNY